MRHCYSSLQLTYTFKMRTKHYSHLQFFFCTLAQSYTPNIYTPTPFPLLYSPNPFTIIRHKRHSAYLFQAAHTPACCIGTKRNKDFHPAMPLPIGNQDYLPNPSRM